MGATPPFYFPIVSHDEIYMHHIFHHVISKENVYPLTPKLSEGGNIPIILLFSCKT